MKTKKQLQAINIYIVVLFAILSFGACKKAHNPTPATPPQGPVPDNWKLTNNLPAENFTALEVINNVIYAGSTTSHRVYMSADGGVNWTASAQIAPNVQINPGIDITALTVFKNKIYVGASVFENDTKLAGVVEDDIYSSSDSGKTWTNERSLTGDITSFAAWDNDLYASSYGDGILKLNAATKQWEPFVNGLTSSFLNLDRIATKVLAIGTDLFAGTAYSFAAFNGTQQGWVRKNYYNHTPYITNNTNWWSDYTIDLVYSPYNYGTLLGQVYMEYPTRQAIMRSDDKGTTWNADTLDLKSDLNRYTMHGLLAGSTKYYSISNEYTTTIIGTWIQHRDRAAPAGTTWASGEEFIPSVWSSAIKEFNGKLFLATNKGLYFKYNN
ncbi:hypothetical protein BEL04_10990 [Mucilaginibacter sp. PPCGB 2223]|uniref:WD40/YVTN/BNR-like repeat-containing protein n=1 Tax=Mucilaginibacter sp. PPCGB 2223 TaxID=1886027 RepID=UPI000826E8A2|nr:hypothetical protein [Mucilaginibacter sp. PPCGB 2223]OCX52026.1 hypothetical protein BEL04_10990 [Mucilaginibacter sp. PPCGB 2223]